MNPLLSREEISALPNATKVRNEGKVCKFVIDPGQNCIVLQGSFHINQTDEIEISPSIEQLYSIWFKEKMVAYGTLRVIDGRMVLKLVHWVGCRDHGISDCVDGYILKFDASASDFDANF